MSNTPNTIEDVIDNLVNAILACAYEGDESAAQAQIQAEGEAIAATHQLIEREKT